MLFQIEEGGCELWSCPCV